jgi:hypothetical protein
MFEIALPPFWLLAMVIVSFLATHAHADYGLPSGVEVRYG